MGFTAPLSLSLSLSLFLSPPYQGEHTWRTEDIISLIEEQGDSIALVWLPGIVKVNKLLRSCDSHVTSFRCALCYWPLV
jgi:hypothetical protein